MTNEKYPITIDVGIGHGSAKLEQRLYEVNQAIDWKHIGDLSNFITSPHSQDVWDNREFRKVRESNVQNDQTSFNGYIFDDTNNVKPSVQWMGHEMRTTNFMEYSIGALQMIALDIAKVLGSILNAILDEAHTLLGVISTDEARTWMPKIYQYQYPHETAKYIGIGIACWGNTIDEHGNATGKWKGCKSNEFSFSNGNH